MQPGSIRNTYDKSRFINKGDEMGRFLLGSTAIVIFEKDRVQLDTSLVPGAAIRMGQSIGTLK